MGISPVDSMKELVGVWSGDCQQSNTQSSRTVKAILEIKQSESDENKFFIYPHIEADKIHLNTTIEWSTYSQKWTGVTGKLSPTIKTIHDAIEINLGFHEIHFTRGLGVDKETAHLAVLDNVGGPWQNGTFCVIKRTK